MANGLIKQLWGVADNKKKRAVEDPLRSPNFQGEWDKKKTKESTLLVERTFGGGPSGAVNKNGNTWSREAAKLEAQLSGGISRYGSGEGQGGRP